MKRILAFVLVLMMILTFACSAYAGQAKVMTSFYPVYIFALNVFDGIDSIDVDCMTASETGCLHDYQLIVSDMMKLAQSDLFVVCGAGMEPYLEDVAQQFPQLPVADCSDGLYFLDDCGAWDNHEHDHDHDHDHDVNAHVWLDIDNAMLMVDNIARSGSERFEAYAEKINANAQAYKARLSALKEELSAQLAPVQGKQTVVFHEAFTYFAHAHGLEVLAVINHENENGLSPAQLSIIIHDVEEAGDPPLFAEDISPTSAAYTVSVETGAKTHAFDPITTGDHVLTAYEDKMRENAKVVLSAFE